MTLVHLKLLLTAIFWGGTFIAGRALAGHVAPFSAAFLRFAVASFFLVMLIIFKEGRLPRLKKQQFCYIFLCGTTGVFSYNLFFFKGLELIQAGRASLIIANNPVVIALLSVVLFNERLNSVRVLGIVISVTGAVIAISRGNLAELLSGGLGVGDFYIMCCVLSWVTYSLIGKHILQDVSPFTAVSYAAVIGTAMLFFPALREGMASDMMNYSAMNWFGIFYLGFFGTVLGFIWYYEGIHKIGAARASLFINFVPISAILLAFFILNEPITISLGIGALLVSSGVYLTNKGTLGKQRLTGNSQ